MEIKTQNSRVKSQNYKSKLKNPAIRSLNQVKEVLYDQNWAKKALNLPLYYMYRGIKRKNGLRYDITIIPPKMLGKEFVKTKGHEHKNHFPELYMVLEGKALYLMQKRDKKGAVLDVFAVKAKNGESIIVPEGYGHITINPGFKNLVAANWANDKCLSDYGFFERKNGACYYYTRSGWVKNKNYKKVPKLRFEKPLKRAPRNLDFLK
ncbi:MAG: hypothetical protein A3H01_01555 [Candidatus Wildermuthbacteria bacterium RIFCSPLOWO2_12_FULL_40_9]|uniref:glucose-6-phosphate isomerase n=2 Tax=Candidatus Wildermuthiibacteriota TaxID=1817923 RepID=A0A1G2RCF2_9BACT|nr:MAG: hypothetical protein A3F15_03030 [Candidatus Wildermuthbacteria bacterium RIFCSPHIGHO2_12_FULL_40_12]OHA76782.1 MAG: hypothetical protein A3H01_01555 [Candidatus Wildermuthbacteria bacterium RIFCSPLOWO2_12_FULL_40_9]